MAAVIGCPRCGSVLNTKKNPEDDSLFFFCETCFSAYQIALGPNGGMVVGEVLGQGRQVLGSHCPMCGQPIAEDPAQPVSEHVTRREDVAPTSDPEEGDPSGQPADQEPAPPAPGGDGVAEGVPEGDREPLDEDSAAVAEARPKGRGRARANR